MSFVFVEQELGAEGWQIGLYIFTTAILELPCFLVASKTVRRLGGPMPTMYVLSAIGAVRYGVGYTVSRNIWQLLCFEWLNAGANRGVNGGVNGGV